ncbi:MAG: hypothetical protein ACXWAT_06765 [Methylobacter sp.]
MITKTKQQWIAGMMVKVGFMTLRVVSSRATPGDYKPDAYLLESKGNFYEFVPHNGLHKLGSSEISTDWPEFA